MSILGYVFFAVIAITSFIAIDKYVSIVVYRLSAIEFELKQIRVHSDSQRPMRLSRVLEQMKLSFPAFADQFSEYDAVHVHDMMFVAVRAVHIELYRDSLVSTHKKLTTIWPRILREKFSLLILMPEGFSEYLESLSDSELFKKFREIRMIVEGIEVSENSAKL